MSQIEEVLNQQAIKGEKLQQRVASLPDGTRSSMIAGLINYDKALTARLADDADAWETETLVYLRSLYGDESTPVKEFESNTNVKNHYFDFKKNLYSDLNKNISILKALSQAETIKETNTIRKNSIDAKTPMVFVSHSSKDIFC